MARREVLVSALAGAGNQGDELILRATLALLRARGLEPTVLSFRPRETASTHAVAALNGLGGAGWVAGLPRLIRAIRQTDLFLLTGGVLQDVHQPYSVARWLLPLWLAQLLGKPTALFCIGAGPLSRARGATLLRRVAASTSLVSVRDGGTERFLRERVGIAGAVVVGADPAFTLALPDRAPASDREPTVGLALRPWPGVDVSWGRELCERLLAAIPGSLLLLPMETHARGGPATCDHEFAIAIRDACRERERIRVPAEAPGADRLLELIAGCDLVIGMRLHALLLAARMGLPIVPLAYDPKVEGLAFELDVAVYPLATAPAVLASAARARLAEQMAATPAGGSRRLRVEALERRCLAVADRLPALLPPSVSFTERIAPLWPFLMEVAAALLTRPKVPLRALSRWLSRRKRTRAPGLSDRRPRANP